ncbi:GntR family transcriptional regulator [Trichococcus flocculiformis]|uniref:GntR family transcriptional regulator n=1 Tax=Trichococcus flocculiformis TaxID=82803 RepID=UPI003DA46EDF
MEKKSKYTQIEDYIIGKIESGELWAGDKIETEEQLSEKFGFSRMTINKAINHLAGKKYINRVPGKGSFVNSKHVTKSLEEQASFTEDMQRIGLKASSELLSYCLVSAKDVPDIAKRLEVSDDSFLHYFVRLRKGDNNPIAITYNYVPTKIVPALDIEALKDSFYEYVRSLGFTILGSEMEIEADLPTEKQRKVLGIDKGAVLKTKTLTSVRKDEKDIILGYFETVYNGNVYTYKFSR